MKNKIFTRIIITTLLVTFLTLNVGRVTSVSAIATTTAAVVAFDCLVALGAIGITYSCLSNAEVSIPLFADTSARDQYLHDCGEKLVQYPAAYDAYQELYRYGLDEPLHNVLDNVWTWTAEKLKAWANDFSSVDTLQNVYSYEYAAEITQPLNGYDYSLVGTQIIIPPYVQISTFDFQPIANYPTCHLYTGYNYVGYDQGRGTWGIYPTNIDSSLELRNYMRSDGQFTVQRFLNGTWSNYVQSYRCGEWDRGYEVQYLMPYANGERGYYANSSAGSAIPVTSSYPVLADAPVYDSVNDRYLPMVVPEADHYQLSPNWNNNQDEPKLPVIPYVQLPWDPNWVNPIGGPSGGGNWGFNLDDLLDKLLDLSGLLCEIGSIAELINQFKNSLTGSDDDAYYIYYDDSNNNYYEYYSITNYGDETYYVYDIDVSEVDEHLPVDLNTIQVYTDNNYVNSVKGHAQKFGEAIGEYVAFWHNSDPESLYTILGSFVVILIGAFIGKWGHS